MKLFRSLFVIALLLCFAIPGFSGDIYNQGTIIDLNQNDIADYDNVSGYMDQGDYVTYVFKTTWIDSSNARHSKPFYIGEVNAVDAYCRAIMSAASDCNVIYHFSYDNRNTWTAVTPATFDALSNSAVGDTIGIEAGTNDLVGFHTGIWLVVEAVAGSTALNDGEVFTWVATFTKDGTFVNGAVRRVAQVANGSNTNP